MSPSPSPLGSERLNRFAQLIERLVQANVEFIVVGGIAGVLAGSGLVTEDLDVLFETSDANIQRLLGVLEDLNAVYRDPLRRRIRPTADKLKTHRLNLFETSLGNFDALPKLSDRWTFEDLLPRSLEYQYADVRFRALSMEALIETKEAAGRPKDQFALLHLRRIVDLNEHTDELQEMLEILDHEDAEARSEPSRD